MGQLGNVGYGVFRLNDKLCVIHPKGIQVIKKESTHESLLDNMVEEAIDTDDFIDYKINTGGVDEC